MYVLNDQEPATGKLDVVFKNKDNGETFVAHQFYKLPMQIMPSYTQDSDGTAFLYMLNPSSGLLQYDRIKISLELKEDAKALVTTPSTNKIYRMDEDCATQITNIKLADNSVMEYLPEHNVPFKGSRYLQQNNYYLEDSSKLIAWDIVTPGRKLCDEYFDFDFYFAETNLFIDGRRILCERTRLEPSINKEQFLHKYLSTGIYEGMDTAGTLIIYSQTDKSRLMDQLYDDCFVEFPRILWGASIPCENLLVIKFLAENVLYMQDALAVVWNTVRKEILGKAAVKIRKV